MFGPNKRRIASLVVASGMLVGGFAAGAGAAAAASTESFPETGSLVVDAVLVDPDPIHVAQAIIADGIIIAFLPLRIILESTGMMPPGCQGPCPAQG